MTQFHVISVPDAFAEDREFLAVVADRHAVVDVQLSDDALAADAAFTGEYGEEVGPGRYRHCSLGDRLGVEDMARVRGFFAALLLALTHEGDRLVWFTSGGLGECDEEHSDDRLVLGGWVDDAGLNGAFALFGGERDHLGHEARRLGAYDRVRAVAGPGLTLTSLLPALTLASPVPTCSRRLDAGKQPFAALLAVLPRARLFVEEIKNGTRLRLISGEMSVEHITAAVAAARATVG